MVQILSDSTSKNMISRIHSLLSMSPTLDLVALAESSTLPASFKPIRYQV